VPRSVSPFSATDSQEVKPSFFSRASSLTVKYASMSIAVPLLAGILVLLTLARLAFVGAYLRSARRADSPAPQRTSWPKVSVFMPVRGVDPFLDRAIRSVMAQDYPNYDLRIIVDSRQDKAWNVVERVRAEMASDRVHLSELSRRQPNCSLVCNAIIQFVEEVGPGSELMVGCDSDMVPPRNWISTMVAALDDPNVGTTLGNRWYMPADSAWGSLVRYAWNASAVIQMWVSHVLWSGGVCLRLSDVHSLGIDAIWKVSLCEDTCLQEVFERAGRPLVFLPQLLVVNRESIGLAACVEFMTRQLYLARLYSPSRNLLSLFPVVQSVGALTTAGANLAAFLTGSFVAGLYGLAGLIGHVAVSLVACAALDRYVRRMMRGRGETTTPWERAALLKMPLVILLAQILFLYTLVASLRIRIFRWRGIEYLVKGPFNVTMLEKSPSPQSAAAPHPVMPTTESGNG